MKKYCSCLYEPSRYCLAVATWIIAALRHHHGALTIAVFLLCGIEWNVYVQVATWRKVGMNSTKRSRTILLPFPTLGAELSHISFLLSLFKRFDFFL